MSYEEPHTGGGHLRPDRGALILVLGILSWVTSCFILGIVAWIMGNGDLREMREGRMDRAGEGTTQAGRILGIIHVVLVLIGTVLFLVALLLGAFAVTQFPAQ